MKQIHVISLVMFTLVMVMFMPFFIILTSKPLPESKKGIPLSGVNNTPNKIDSDTTKGKMTRQEFPPSIKTELAKEKAELPEERKPEEFRIENVKKVFVHTPGGYSVLSENPYSKELVNSGHLGDLDFIQSRASTWSGARVVTKIYNDVDGESGYVVIRFYNSTYFEADIHIPVKDITGGDFKYRTSSKGSSRTGTTREAN